ncbi:hypothetical protein EYF80_036709 [Liparis tanakae]|uniref:Uncharacterized protein n=1 Tax=Liparis tanakae TaxID=230148 RepID=A0A4Z2GJV0_9TELE|nr:hypothetical protein EYF80_036709 [Liparis tanakae]
MHNHCFLPLSSPPVAAAGRLEIVGAGLAASRHLSQEAGQAGAAALAVLVAAQGLHTAEGLRLGGRQRLEGRDKGLKEKGDGNAETGDAVGMKPNFCYLAGNSKTETGQCDLFQQERGVRSTMRAHAIVSLLLAGCLPRDVLRQHALFKPSVEHSGDNPRVCHASNRTHRAPSAMQPRSLLKPCNLTPCREDGACSG